MDTMSSDIDIVSKLFRKAIVIGSKKSKLSGFTPPNYVKLIDNLGLEVQIDYVPKKAIIIDLDKIILFKYLPEIFNCKAKIGNCKYADYIIFCEMEKDNFILYLEIKHRKIDQESFELVDIEKQLRGAKCFVRYCQELGKQFYEKKFFLENYKEQFIVISDINEKQSTYYEKPKKRKVSNDPRRPKIIYGPKINFNQLIW